MNRQEAPRSGRIVAELRQRIEAGELAPGDRVPSTREITRQWGVAMATATRVLAELRQEGLVRAVRGVGTVVEARSKPARTGRPPAAGRPDASPAPASPARRQPVADEALTLGRIVTSAIAVADAEGLAAVSMRRVAADLGVATMSLYRHVADKDDLLMRMMDAAFSRWTFPAVPPEGWREQLTLAARMLWDMFRRHPWLAPALSLARPQAVAGALPFTEWVLTALERHGLDFSLAFTVHLTLFNYVRGTAFNVEMEREAEALTGLDSEEWMDAQEPAFQALLATGRFPALGRLTESGYDFDLDGLFTFGLQRLLDGIAAFMEAARNDAEREAAT
ncbi:MULTISPECIES: TetR/AcrR family transcriptional regulator C-terminal domain-containing protein [Streptomyces]|uniref:TetR/AcrR family transcriptional regulator C-terminal domain-containing protein n=1 Tax=Streptomyces TaxID=1883 RepID=UPI00069A38D5|nr:GntR family transcriptional regulator [Streptomyces sp. SID7805]